MHGILYPSKVKTRASLFIANAPNLPRTSLEWKLHKWSPFSWLAVSWSAGSLRIRISGPRAWLAPLPGLLFALDALLYEGLQNYFHDGTCM
ncbi:hypothetical protein BDV27DRAFT_133769 [Aspergillus caelatus]|uniref:Uncharacterized protein n=1 Tax=Aspergillus caelatus TaxID=61420 RepID=A0A5N6ZXC2_9EURO|nr:uncharacterized protein BDV27DRAFT_133769 [Aspergillus caelatus]KAE8360920.1 hypothetical protein BDV27DRAFT_133769 [Aspergillus caelatus]